MSRRCPSARLSTTFAVLLLAFAPRPARAAEPDGAARVEALVGPAIASAVDDAARRLESGPCSAVLTDFVDTATGLTLADRLAMTGRTASEYVRSLSFRFAPSIRPFGGRRVFAFTTPESRLVFLCRDDLLRVQNQKRLVRAVLIHEVLHTLGLRDDRPSSAEITARVLMRCG